jgi:hypothetical protein
MLAAEVAGVSNFEAHMKWRERVEAARNAERVLVVRNDTKLNNSSLMQGPCCLIREDLSQEWHITRKFLSDFQMRAYAITQCQISSSWLRKRPLLVLGKTESVFS